MTLNQQPLSCEAPITVDNPAWHAVTTLPIQGCWVIYNMFLQTHQHHPHSSTSHDPRVPTSRNKLSWNEPQAESTLLRNTNYCKYFPRHAMATLQRPRPCLPMTAQQHIYHMSLQIHQHLSSYLPLVWRIFCNNSHLSMHQLQQWASTTSENTVYRVVGSFLKSW